MRQSARAGLRAVLVLGICLAATAALAQAQRPDGAAAEGGADAGQRPATPPAPAPSLPADAVTSHTITVAGRQLAYTARAGALPLMNAAGETQAEVFFVAYTLDGVAAAKRPITFAFNGGPGAGSVYLQLGALGPRVLDMGDGRGPPFGAGGLIDNPDTWLAFTDLVFIDPVGTGYSLPTPAVKDPAKAFWTVETDIDSIEAAIRLALARLDRFASPVYLAGESYGGYRVARLAGRLPIDQGIAVRGVTMVSPVIEFSLGHTSPYDPLAWALKLPSYAAAALDREGKLSPEALAAPEKFALGRYLATLVAPPADSGARKAFYAQVAAMIGLPEAVVERWQGMVPTGIYDKEIGHAKDEVASAYDASFDAADPFPSEPYNEGPDPILAGLIGPLTTAAVAYFQDELKFHTPRHYQLLDDEVGRRWDWDNKDPFGGVGAAGNLRAGLALDPRLRVLIAHGMTDEVTPYMTDRFLIDHLPPGLKGERVQFRLFPGGHMMYLRPESRAGLAKAAAELVYGQP